MTRTEAGTVWNEPKPNDPEQARVVFREIQNTSTKSCFKDGCLIFEAAIREALGRVDVGSKLKSNRGSAVESVLL
jgi:hypothetical protein